MTRQRIMLVEIQPSIPGNRVYATLSPTDKAATVSVAGNSATGTVAAWASVRATVALGAGVTYFETTATYAAGQDVRTGAAVAGYSLSAALGADVVGNSASGPDRAGDCRFRNVVTINGANIASGTVIRHLVDADQGVYKIAVGAGAFQTALKFAGLSRQPFYPILSVFGAATVAANFGASTFAYAVPAGAMAGVFYQPEPTTRSIYLSSAEFGTGPDDLPANQLYDARLARDVDLVISCEAGCWVWGNTGRSARGVLAVNNGDRRYDEWLRWQWRDASYTVFSGFKGDARADFRVYAKGVCNRLNREGDRRLILTLADPLDRLDKPFQRKLYTSAANAQSVDSPRPVAIGRPMYVPAVLRSTAQTGPDAFTYDAHDDVLVSIDAAYDRGSLFLPPTVDWTYLAEGTGLKLVNKPIGRVSICPQGATVSAGAALLSSTFTSLAGWSNESGAGSSVTVVAGGARFVGAVATIAVLRRSGLFTGVTGRVRIDVTLKTLVSGQIVVRADPSATILRAVTRGLSISVIADVTTESDLLLITSASSDITVASVVVSPIRLAETLPDVIRYIAVDNGPLTDDEVDWDAINTLHAAAPYRVAEFVDGETTGLALLRSLMHSWCGSVVPNRRGQLTAGRIGSPGPRSAVRLTKSLNVFSVNQRFDVASGLTTRLGGRRNFNKHSAGDIADGVPAPLRAELMSEFTLIRSSSQVVADAPLRANGRLSRAYLHADGAEPQATWIQDADDLQTEANRVGTFTADERDHYLFDVECTLSAEDADLIELFHDVWLQWPSYDLDDGQWLTVVGIAPRFFARTVSLVLAPFDQSHKA